MGYAPKFSLLKVCGRDIIIGIIDLYPLVPWVAKNDFYLTWFFAICFISLQFLPSFLISLSANLLHITFLLHREFHSRNCWVILLLGLLRIWPNQFIILSFLTYFFNWTLIWSSQFFIWDPLWPMNIINSSGTVIYFKSLVRNRLCDFPCLTAT